MQAFCHINAGSNCTDIGILPHQCGLWSIPTRVFLPHRCKLSTARMRTSCYTNADFLTHGCCLSSARTRASNLANADLLPDRCRFPSPVTPSCQIDEGFLQRARRLPCREDGINLAGRRDWLPTMASWSCPSSRSTRIPLKHCELFLRSGRSHYPYTSRFLPWRPLPR